MIALLRLVLLLSLLVSPRALRGDGKIFSPIGFVRAETPAQRALIHWTNGVETLVIETTVRATATNLAWILPVPAPPTVIQPVDPGLFPTLHTTFQARAILTKSRAWIGGLIVASLILLIRWMAQRKLPVRTLDWLLIGLLLLFLASHFLPALAKARAKGGGEPLTGSSVQLLGETRAGVFHLTTLAAERPEDLVAWLSERGFSTPADVQPLVADYLARRWVFVAAQIAVTETNSLAALHPVALTFPTRRPVYPLRLTGVESGALRCDLYVFGPARAAAPGWRVAFCAQPSYATNLGTQVAPHGLRVRHPELARLVGLAPVATKLSATLEGPDFNADVFLDWHRFSPVGQVAYTRSSALSRAASMAAWTLALGCLAGSLGLRRTVDSPAPSWFNALDVLGGAASLAVAASAWIAMPQIPGEDLQTLRRRPAAEARNQALHLALETADLPGTQELLLQPEPVSALQIAEIRRELGHCLRTNRYPAPFAHEGRWMTNLFSPDRVRIEASPGNVTLEPSEQGLDLVWHDFDGAPAVRVPVPRFPPPSPASSPRP